MCRRWQKLTCIRGSICQKSSLANQNDLCHAALLLKIPGQRMTNLGITQANSRIDFTAATKKILCTAAGSRCCFRDCLVLTEGDSRNKKGKRLRSIGVAAHIYAASEKGARGRVGLSVEQIKDPSNGIWLCAKHGRLVDDFVDSYSAEFLLRMKAVRELAHTIELHNDLVSFFVNMTGVRDWNEFVWAFTSSTPSSDIDKIKCRDFVNDFLSQAARKKSILDRHRDEILLRTVPEQAINPMVKALLSAYPAPQESNMEKSMTGQMRMPLVNSYSIERERATGIARAWMAKLGNNNHVGIISDGEICLAARAPISRSISDERVWQTATVEGRANAPSEQGEEVAVKVHHSFDRVSAFNWKLSVEVGSGTYRVSSKISCRATPDYYLRDQRDRAKFFSYHELIKKIASGWELVGYLGLSLSERGLHSVENLHPSPFHIEIDLADAAFKSTVRNCEKVAAGLDSARRWASRNGVSRIEYAEFIFNKIFLLEIIDSDLIYYALDELFKNCGTQKNSSEKLLIGPFISLLNRANSGIFLCLHQGRLFFDNVGSCAGNSYRVSNSNRDAL